MEAHLLIIIAVFCSLTLGAGGWLLGRRLGRLRRENERLGRELALLRRQLQGAGFTPWPDEPREAASDRGADFGASLDYAGLKMRLQSGDRGGEIPEKYRVMAAMVRRGLVGKDIAEVLKISPAETEQLVRLAGLSAPLPTEAASQETRRGGKRVARKRAAGRAGSDRTD